VCEPYWGKNLKERRVDHREVVSAHSEKKVGRYSVKVVSVIIERSRKSYGTEREEGGRVSTEKLGPLLWHWPVGRQEKVPRYKQLSSNLPFSRKDG